MKRSLTCLLVLAMLAALLPAAALAATPADGAPTGSGKNFYANGTSITIQAAPPAGGQEVTLGGFTSVASDGCIVWNQGGMEKFVWVKSDCRVFGGADGTAGPVSVSNTNINMVGGSVYRIYGGCAGKDNTAADGVLDEASAVMGNSTMTMTGGHVEDYLVGGGLNNAATHGTVRMSIRGGTFGNLCYVQGGVHGNGKEGILSANDTISTNAVVNNVVLDISNVDLGQQYPDGAYYNTLAGGGSGYTKVSSVTMTIGDNDMAQRTKIANVLSGGVNGTTAASTLTVKNDASIRVLGATNRGYVGTGSMTIQGGSITQLNTGAIPDCFATDGSTGSAVTGSMTINIANAAGIAQANITPNITNAGGTLTAELGALTINNTDTANPLTFSAPQLDTGDASGRTTNPITVYTVAAGDTVQLQGNTTVAIGGTGGAALSNSGVIALSGGAGLTNSGTLTNGTSGTLSVAAGSTLTNTGTLNNAGTVSNSGTVNNTGAISGTGEVDNRTGSSYSGNTPTNGTVKYEVKVNSGSGSALYTAGTTVNIQANTIANKRFTRWTATGVTLSAPTAASTSFAMPRGPVELTAEYAQLYTVTMSGGSSDATQYTQGATVSIRATVPAGRTFKRWVSTPGVTFNNANAANTTFTMPASNVTVTAELVDIYTVTVNNGSADSPQYAQGATVSIRATVPAGRTFKRWVSSTPGVTFNNANAANTTFTMPASNVTVTAEFAAAHTLRVVSGRDVTNRGPYISGTQVSIAADVPLVFGRLFDHWESNNGGTFANSRSAQTTFTMPDADVTVTAVYAAQTTYRLTVVGGFGSGSYAAGAYVSIGATTSASSVFSRWTTSNGGEFGNAFRATTYFIMPAHDVTITAQCINNVVPVVPLTPVTPVTPSAPVAAITTVPIPDVPATGAESPVWMLLAMAALMCAACLRVNYKERRGARKETYDRW